MDISYIAAGSAAGAADVGVMSLEQRFGGALAQAYVAAGRDEAAIERASNDPRVASNPQDLFDLQLQLQDYTKRMIVAAGLVNRGVKTVETLLKS